MSVSRMFSQEIVSSVFFATLPSEELAGTGWLHTMSQIHTHRHATMYLWTRLLYQRFEMDQRLKLQSDHTSGYCSGRANISS